MSTRRRPKHTRAADHLSPDYAPIRLSAQLRRRHDERDAHAQQHDHKPRPSNQALGAQAVRVAALAPQVRGVDGRVAVDVGAVLVGELLWVGLFWG